MEKNEYFRRIGIEKQNLLPSAENLKYLQKQHLLNVPFENLDIHWKRPIKLDNKRFYEKIVREMRGGFCYELNGLFYELLNDVGFQSKLISARVKQKDGKLSAEYDHLAILTKIDSEEFLTDTGFGDFSVEPLKFILDIEQEDENGTFLIKKYDDTYFEVLRKQAEDWKSEYVFSDLKRDLSEFEGMCNFHQTSPESHFTRGKVCSLLLVNGRKTLTDKKFIKTSGSKRIETKISSEDEFNNILKREFNIEKSFSL